MREVDRRDAREALDAYRTLGPWCLRDLVALARAILEASSVVPRSRAAQPHPTERTVRFYVSRGLVDCADGRGTAAVYGFRHLLQVLAIKLQQMDGGSLADVSSAIAGLDDAALTTRVATTLGPAVPAPEELGGLEFLGGRVAQAPPPAEERRAPPAVMLVRRVPIAHGLDLLIEAAHPLFRLAGSERIVAEAIQELVEDLVHGRGAAGSASPLRRGG